MVEKQIQALLQALLKNPSNELLESSLQVIYHPSHMGENFYIMKRKAHLMEKGLVAGVIAILLGILAVFVGWTIIGGLVLGLIALLLAICSYREGHRLLGAIGIVFACVGLVEGLMVAGIMGLFSIPTMFAKTGIKTTTTTETTKSGLVAKIGEKIHLPNGITLTVDYVNVTDKFVTKECYACSAKPKYKIVIVHLTIRNDGIRETSTLWRSDFIIEVDKGYQYDPIEIELLRYERQSWKINETECLRYYCKDSWAGSLLPEEEDYGCIFFEILATTNPAKLIYHSYTYGDVTILLTK